MSHFRNTECARCGIRRKSDPKRPLCRDCWSVLSKEEWALWVSEEVAVELYHEKEVA